MILTGTLENHPKTRDNMEEKRSKAIRSHHDYKEKPEDHMGHGPWKMERISHKAGSSYKTHRRRRRGGRKEKV